MQEVTPCVGVWIETLARTIRTRWQPVTPCVGVWIETSSLSQMTSDEYVTPCVGVWIETALLDQSKEYQESHPAWVCGLKPTFRWWSWLVRCHTLRGCVD